MKHDSIMDLLKDMVSNYLLTYGEYPKRVFLNLIEAKNLLKEERLAQNYPQDWEAWLNGKDVDAWYMHDRVVIKMLVRK